MEKPGINKDPVQILPGQNGLPRVILTSPDFAQAEIYLHGAHLTSWIPGGGNECLYLSRTAVFDSSTPIRGGVPIIFPQFSGYGSLINHGFARTQPWMLSASHANADTASARFILNDSPATKELWPYQFQLEFAITIGGPRLILELYVTNLGMRPFTFTSALHTYLRINHIDEATIEGLQSAEFYDQVDKGSPTRQQDQLLKIAGEIDRIYYNPKPRIMLNDGQNRFRISSRGFGDLVIWNPGPERSAKIIDLEPDGYRHMICVEAAVIRRPVRLSSDESWHGSQIITQQ